MAKYFKYYRSYVQECHRQNVIFAHVYGNLAIRKANRGADLSFKALVARAPHFRTCAPATSIYLAGMRPVHVQNSARQTLPQATTARVRLRA